MSSSGQQKWFHITDSWRSLEIQCNIAVSTVCVDDLSLLDSRSYLGIVMTELGSHIYGRHHGTWWVLCKVGHVVADLTLNSIAGALELCLAHWYINIFYYFMWHGPVSHNYLHIEQQWQMMEHRSDCILNKTPYHMSLGYVLWISWEKLTIDWRDSTVICQKLKSKSQNILAKCAIVKGWQLCWHMYSMLAFYRGHCNTENLPRAYLQHNSCETIFACNILFISAMVQEFCIWYGSDTVIPCANFQNNSVTEIDVIVRWELTRFGCQDKMPIL